MSLTTKGHFSINGKEFSAKAIKVGFESLASENSGRTLDGILHIDWVLSRIRKVEIEMPPMSSADVSRLLSLVQGREYTLVYFDPLDNAEKAIEVYTSNSSSDMYSGVLYNGLWQGVKFNAIEIGGEV